MKWLSSVLFLIGICVSSGAPVPARAQGLRPATECMYAGSLPLSNLDDPVRFDIDADGHGLTFIHNVQTNKPFEMPTFAEKPSCHLKLDCVVSTQGLKNVGVETVQSPQGPYVKQMLWVRIGFSVAFKYDKEANERTCHVVGIESLYF